MNTITSNMIIGELLNRGYKAELTTTIKNGIEKEGICIRNNSCVNPVIYTDKLLLMVQKNGCNLLEITDEVENIIKSHKMDFDFSQLTDGAYILEHVRIGLQKRGREEIIKRPSLFEGLEEYLFIEGIHFGSGFTMKINEKLVMNAGLTLSNVWRAAHENNRVETTIETIESAVSRSMGGTVLENDESNIYVISNKKRVRGASAVLNRQAIAELADKIGVRDFVVIPSSIHECILIPKLQGMHLEYFDNMVKEVNATVVDPEDQLIDRAYSISV